jgi:type IV pilus assembly protein PilM
MAFPFIDSRSGKKREQTLAVDLGGRTTKAVRVQRRGQGFALSGYTLLDAPIFDKTISAEMLTEHLKVLTQTLPATAKHVTLTVGVNDALVRHADMPRMPIDDLRLALTLNAKNYLQQDLPGHLFDCHIGATGQPQKTVQKPLESAGPPKQRVLVTGARKQLIEDYVRGAKGAGLTVDCIVPGLIGPVNVFEKVQPEIFAKEAVALVELGFKNTSICIIQQGELILSRVVGIGGDRMTNGLAEALNVSYAEAEGIKLGMPGEVQAQLEALVLPLGRELRASMDFFEHQQDCPVTHVFLSGGSARSEFMVQKLQHELMIECKILNPTTFLQMELPPQQAGELEQLAPQLTVALGAALAAL